MVYYVGLDISKHTTAICILSQNGTVAEEGVSPSDPKAIASFLRGKRRRYAKVGLEACGFSSWLHDGLSACGFPVVTIEALHAHGVLSAARHSKTDRNDARGLAEIMRSGLYKPVYTKSSVTRDIQMKITVRRILVVKMYDIENGIRGLLLSRGIRLRPNLSTNFTKHFVTLTRDYLELRSILRPLQAIRDELFDRVEALNVELEAYARSDPVCRRLMTAPGVGPITALAYQAAIEDPRRFNRSRDVGAYLGLTPRIYQSGQTEIRGRITKKGDASVRSLLFMAALVQMRSSSRSSWLKVWGQQVAARRGRKKAIIAVARRLAVLLHSMWLNEQDFRWLEDAS